MSIHHQPSSLRNLLKPLAILAGCAAASSTVRAEDPALAAKYFQLYGSVDLGYSYQKHGNAFNPDLATNVNVFLTKYNSTSRASIASNGLSLSTIGARSEIPLNTDLSGLAQLESSFSPASGSIVDGPGSIAANNGAAPANYTSFGDSNKAGQFLNGNVFLGLESRSYGRLTIGRNSSLMSESICRNDALYCAPAFSYVGYFGAAAGMGDTEDRFMDGTVKYAGNLGAVRVGALYQPARLASQTGGGAVGSAFQFSLGSSMGALSLEGVAGRRRDGILLASPLSAAQVSGTATPGSAAYGLPADKTLNGVVSDNTAYGLFGRYDGGELKVFAGYENVRQANPASPLATGTETIGGYRIVANNTAFPKPKVTQYTWVGVRYSPSQRWDLAASLYDVEQASYRSGASCSDQSSSLCSGRYWALGGVADYKLADSGFMKGFDVYCGVVHSSASGGVVSGYLNKTNLSAMAGMRYVF